jgi:putative ABC transport system permease protein
MGERRGAERVAPPEWARRALGVLLRRAGDAASLEELDELYELRAARRGAALAGWWYMRVCAGFWLRLPLEALRRNARRRRSGASAVAAGRRAGLSGVDGLRQDVRTAVRSLYRQPGHTIAAVLTLGLAMAGAVSVYAVANWVMLRPVPWVAEPEALSTIRLQSTESEVAHWRISDRDYRELARGLRSAFDVAAVVDQEVHLSPAVGEPVRLPAQAVSANYFDVLGVRPAEGRSFVAAEDEAGAAVVVVSAQLRRRFGGDGSLDPGRTVRLNGRPFTVVGVAPAGFRGADLPGAAELWFPAGAVPLVLNEPGVLTARGSGLWSDLIARLRPGATTLRLESELARAMEGIRRQGGSHSFLANHFILRAHEGIGLSQSYRRQVERTLALLAGASALLFLMGAANAANLGLARTIALSSALGIRRALGAPGWRIVRERLSESVVVALAGSAIGVIGAGLIARAFEGASVTPGATALHGVQLDARVLGFAAAIAVLAGGLAGVLPAHTALRTDGAVLLRAARHGERRGRRLRDALVVAQVALSIVLVVVAGLFARTLWNLRSIDLGIDPDPVLAFVVNPGIQGHDATRTQQLVGELVRRLAAEPGASAAGATYTGAFDRLFVPLPVMPLGGAWGGNGVAPRSFQVAGDAFGALGLRFVAGRAFTPHELAAADTALSDVIVLNESAARALFPDRSSVDVVGQLLCRPASLGDGEPCDIEEGTITVVGIVADARLGRVIDAGQPYAFQPWTQRYAPDAANVYVRVAGDPLALAASARRVLQALDPDLPPYALGRLRDVVDAQLAEQRFVAGLSLLLGVLAVALAAGGLYAVLAYAVAARTREIGIRSALGARPGRILRLVIGAGLGRTALGVAFGIATAAVASRFVEARLFGVTPFDAPTYAGGALLLLVVAVAAAGVPGRRALRIDPVEALRRE